ncbi:MAG: hypothetical protein AAFQ87_06480 [Bacteroidota bacterium]
MRSKGGLAASRNAFLSYRQILRPNDDRYKRSAKQAKSPWHQKTCLQTLEQDMRLLNINKPNMGELLLSLIGAPIRWLFFFGKKSWEEIFDDKFNYNPIVGFLVLFIILLFFLPVQEAA